MDRPGTVACRNCGALNEPDFKRCIRCNRSLGDAEPADQAKRRVPAKRRRPGTLRGPGAEPFLGRFPVEQLPGTKLLILLNLMVFTLHIMGALTRGGGVGEVIMKGGGGFEALLYGALPTNRIREGAIALSPFSEVWRTLSACFVHYGILHIGMNMSALLSLSRQVEPAIGTARYLILYVISGIVGFMASIAWNLAFGTVGLSAGASGAIFGVYGSIAGILWRQGDPNWKSAAGRCVGALVVLAIIPIPIDNTAHAGGMVAGMALGAALSEGAPRPSSTWQQVGATLAVLACLAAIIAPRFSPNYEPLLQRIADERKS